MALPRTRTPGTRTLGTRKLGLVTAAAVAVLTAGLAWQASAADSDGGGRTSPGAKPDAAIARDAEHDTSPAADYWTPERMRAAQPAPMPVVPGDDHR
ncbi:hypothetical protein [Streptomyces sp. NPDC059063]